MVPKASFYGPPFESCLAAIPTWGISRHTFIHRRRLLRMLAGRSLSFLGYRRHVRLHVFVSLALRCMLGYTCQTQADNALLPRHAIGTPRPLVQTGAISVLSLLSPPPMGIGCTYIHTTLITCVSTCTLRDIIVPFRMTASTESLSPPLTGTRHVKPGGASAKGRGSSARRLFLLSA